jgi:hypothetical protein
VDFNRPSRLVGQILNKLILLIIPLTSYYSAAVRNQKKWEKQYYAGMA